MSTETGGAGIFCREGTLIADPRALDRHPASGLDGRSPRGGGRNRGAAREAHPAGRGLVNKADREPEESSEHATQLVATLGLDEIAEPPLPARPWLHERESE